MLQFNKSEATNVNAVYLDTVNTGSDYYSSLKVVYSQSYDLSSGSFDVTATSIPNQYRSWLIISNSGSVVPTPSGQYDVEIYTFTSASEAIWGTFSSLWSAVSDTWSTVGGNDEVLNDLLYSDRAFVSGSDDSSITQYVSSNENGTYITYNG
jgi:hypothetical protein